MSVSNAKRYGIEVKNNLDLEHRIRGIEKNIFTKAIANRSPNLDITTLRATPPRISGLTLRATNIGEFEFSWNPSSISDLKYYQIQIADNDEFSSPVIIGVGETFYLYTDAEPNVTYYVRVRAINSLSIPGVWSGVLNATTGLVITTDFETGAAKELTILTVSSGFNQLVAGGSLTGPGMTPAYTPTPNQLSDTYGPVTVDIEQASTIVVPYLYMHGDMQIIYNPYYRDLSGNVLCNMTIDFLRRPEGGSTDTTLDSAIVDLFSSSPGSIEALTYYHNVVPPAGYDISEVEIRTPALPDIPGIGTWEYRIQITLEATSGQAYISYLPNSLDFRFLRYKR